MAKDNKKRVRPNRYARQYVRTAGNIAKRRDAHRKAHPNDNECKKNWEKSPIKTKK